MVAIFEVIAAATVAIGTDVEEDGNDNVDVNDDDDPDVVIARADALDIGAVVVRVVGNTVADSSSSSNTCIGKGGNVGGGVLERRRSIKDGVEIDVGLVL